jgi:hypothetical protein
MMLGAIKEMIVGLVRDRQIYMKVWISPFIRYKIQSNDSEVM